MNRTYFNELTIGDLKLIKEEFGYNVDWNTDKRILVFMGMMKQKWQKEAKGLMFSNDDEDEIMTYDELNGD